MPFTGYNLSALLLAVFERRFEMAKYYKSLRENLTSWYDPQFKWNTEEVICLNPSKTNKPCARGIHLAKTIEQAVGYGQFPCVLYEVEPLSEVLGEDETKVRVMKARLVKPIKMPVWVKKTNNFIKSIAQIPWFKAVKPPLKKWKMFDSRDSAFASAFDSARASAFASARARTYDSARDSAYDSALYAGYCICADLSIDKRHRQHVHDRWEVWKRGWGLRCDINGVLYVYKKP